MRLTDVLAMYGAGVSTFAAVSNYLRTKSQVRVCLVFSLRTIQGESQTGIDISVQNVSAQTVHITNVALLYPLRRSTFRDKLEHLIRFKRIPRNEGWCSSHLSLYGVDDGCHMSIESGKSHDIFVRHEVLDALLEQAQSRRIKAIVQDALWRNTYSKAFTYPAWQKEVAKIALAR